jgi:hypothetical protein
MKAIVCAIALFTAGSANAAEMIRHVIDWNKASTLEESLVQQCDDTYADGFEIVVPGEPRTNFSVEMSVSITNGRVSQGCTLLGMKKAAGTTIYLLDASGGGCDINVIQSKTGKKAIITLADAC